MRAHRVATLGESLLAAEAPIWSGITRQTLTLSPSPTGLGAAVSPWMAISQGHGRIPAVELRAVHDGEALALRLGWTDPSRDDRIGDLDRFVDAAAVMFPLRGDTNPLTMGDETHPVNAWLWKADRPEPFDVLAHGFSTSVRRPASESGLVAEGAWQEGRWTLTFRRALRAPRDGCVELRPGEPTSLAVAVWDGLNRDRAGQKAVTPAFLALSLDA